MACEQPGAFPVNVLDLVFFWKGSSPSESLLSSVASELELLVSSLFLLNLILGRLNFGSKLVSFQLHRLDFNMAFNLSLSLPLSLSFCPSISSFSSSLSPPPRQALPLQGLPPRNQDPAIAAESQGAPVACLVLEVHSPWDRLVYFFEFSAVKQLGAGGLVICSHYFPRNKQKIGFLNSPFP